MVKPYLPERGDIVWLSFEPSKGKEINKRRPALVISPQKYNAKTSLALFLPITSKIKGYPFEVQLEVQRQKGAVLCDQLRSLDWQARAAEKIETVEISILEEILTKVRLLLY